MHVNYVTMSVAYNGRFRSSHKDDQVWACFDAKADVDNGRSWDLTVYTENKEVVDAVSNYLNDLNVGKGLVVIGSIHRATDKMLIKAKEIIKNDEFISNSQAKRLKPRTVDFGEGLF